MQRSRLAVVCFLLPLVGRGGFPSFSALVGRVVGWRSSGCAVRAHNRQFALYKRLGGSLVVGGITYRSHPDGRLYALYLCSGGPLWVVGIFHTTHK